MRHILSNSVNGSWWLIEIEKNVPSAAACSMIDRMSSFLSTLTGSVGLAANRQWSHFSGQKYARSIVRPECFFPRLGVNVSVILMATFDVSYFAFT